MAIRRNARVRDRGTIPRGPDPMSFMTRRRAIFLAVLAALVVVVAFTATRLGGILPVGVEVRVTDEPAPKPKSGPASVSVIAHSVA